MRALPAVENTILPSQNGDVLELDELWSFVELKTQQAWLWIALCRRTRQIVAYTGGDHSQESACDLPCEPPAGLPPPCHPQRLLAGLRSGLSKAHASLGYEAMHVLRKGQIATVPAGNVRAQNRFIEVLFGVAA